MNLFLFIIGGGIQVVDSVIPFVNPLLSGPVFVQLRGCEVIAGLLSKGLDLLLDELD
jgi:hypothetical protein